jgi:aminoglycoside phosphotransferase (APT) family kinase protein
MAEIVALDGEDGRVVKLDRPEWSGVSAFESDVIGRVAAMGIPIAQSHGTITLEGRCGVVLDRIEGQSLENVLTSDSETLDQDGIARKFVVLQGDINAVSIDGLPDLIRRLVDEITRSGLSAGVVDRLWRRLDKLDDGERCLCHFDFHPGNVLVSPNGWVVVDWLGAASGPPAADFARSLLLLGFHIPRANREFVQAVRRRGMQRTSLDDDAVDEWVRVLAAARIAEGYDGDYREWLISVAEGTTLLQTI